MDLCSQARERQNRLLSPYFLTQPALITLSPPYIPNLIYGSWEAGEPHHLPPYLITPGMERNLRRENLECVITADCTYHYFACN